MVSYIVFALIGIFVSRPFFASQTEIAEVQEYGTAYLTICCVAGVGIFMQMIFERLLQSTGKTFYTMITQGIGAIVNLILDPILIFGYFGMPKMGVAGAATATVIGQMAAAVLAVIFNLKCNREIHISFRGFRPDRGLIAQIYKVGVPSIVMQAIGSVMTYGMNLILGAFGAAQTVFGVYFKLQSFIFMPIFGLNNGMVPIIAYNYGAGSRTRVIQTMKSSIKYAVGIMLAGLVIYGSISGTADPAVQCHTGAFDNRRAGASHNLLEFLFCRVLYCGGQCVSGIGKRRIQYDYIHCQTALCAASGGIPAFPQRQCQFDLVGIPHRRIDESGHEYIFPDKNK